MNDAKKALEELKGIFLPGWFKENGMPIANTIGLEYADLIRPVEELLDDIELIESEIGLNIVEFHNLLRCGGYYKTSDGNFKFGYLNYDHDTESYVFGDTVEDYVKPTAENYGKEWFLSKNDMEGNEK